MKRNACTAIRVTEIEQGTFTPLIFANWRNGKGVSHISQSRLSELIANKKGEVYSKTMAWIRAKISFSILRSALLCLRGSRTIRKIRCNIENIDLDVETNTGRIN